MRGSEGVLLDGGGGRAAHDCVPAGPSQRVPHRLLLNGVRQVGPHLTPHRGMPSAPPGRQAPRVTHS
jgi:hypothetical protein